jgi:hypothetical protein
VAVTIIDFLYYLNFSYVEWHNFHYNLLSFNFQNLFNAIKVLFLPEVRQNDYNFKVVD